MFRKIHTRRLMRIGGTYCLSLPKDWLKKILGEKIGEKEVYFYVIEEGDKLVVRFAGVEKGEGVTDEVFQER